MNVPNLVTMQSQYLISAIMELFELLQHIKYKIRLTPGCSKHYKCVAFRLVKEHRRCAERSRSRREIAESNFDGAK